MSHGAAKFCAYIQCDSQETNCWTQTFLCKLRELLDLGDLSETLLFGKTLEGVFEKVGVRSETRVFWNAVVVLTEAYSESVYLSGHRKRSTFPVRRPLASADHTVVPMAYFLYKGAYSFSGRSRWNMLG